MQREDLPGGYVLGNRVRNEKGLSRGETSEWKTVYQEGRKIRVRNKQVYWVKTPKTSERWDTSDHRHIVPVYEDNPLMQKLDTKGYEIIGTEEDRLRGKIKIPKRFVDESWHDPDARKAAHSYEAMDFEEPAQNEQALIKAERILRNKERLDRRQQLSALASEVTEAKRIIKEHEGTADITTVTKRRGRPRKQSSNETQLSTQ